MENILEETRFIIDVKDLTNIFSYNATGFSSNVLIFLEMYLLNEP